MTAPERARYHGIIITTNSLLEVGTVVTGAALTDERGHQVENPPPMYIIRKATRKEWREQLQAIGEPTVRGGIWFYEVSVD